MILKKYQKDGYETIVYTVDGVNPSSTVTFPIQTINEELPQDIQLGKGIVERLEELEDAVTEVIIKVYE